MQIYVKETLPTYICGSSERCFTAESTQHVKIWMGVGFKAIPFKNNSL